MPGLSLSVPSAIAPSTSVAMSVSGGHTRGSIPSTGHATITKNGKGMSKIKDAILNIEVKKAFLRQNKDGYTLGLILHPSDLPDGLMRAPVGTRFQVALVEIGDDEQPVVPRDVHVAKKLVAVAGEMCRVPEFQMWLRPDLVHSPEAIREDLASAELRDQLNVESRADLEHDEVAQQRFRVLLDQYDESQHKIY